MKFNGIKENGKFRIYSKEAFDNYINSIKDGQLLQMDIRPKRKMRSISQNSLYWVWLDIAGTDLGYDSEELHDTFKSLFLVDRTLKIPLVRSTTKLTTSEFTKYMDKVQRYCLQELNIHLPDPEEYYNQQNNASYTK